MVSYAEVKPKHLVAESLEARQLLKQLANDRNS